MLPTSDPTPTFLVLTDDGHLHGYDRPVILRAHLACGNPPLKIFRLQTDTLTISYRPIDASEITVDRDPLIEAQPTALALLPAPTPNHSSLAKTT